jgi:hypothetical protein
VGCDIMKRRRYVRRVVSGKWFWSGGVLMQSIHATLGWGPPGKTTSFQTPPPPPTVKGRTVGGVQKLLSVVHPRTICWTVDLCALVNHHSGPPPPPPTVKGRTVWGVQKLISAIDLGANSSVVDLCAIFNLRA